MKFTLAIVIGSCAAVLAQDKFNIAESINKFSVDLLAAVHAEGGESLNIALSPLTIWTLLTVVSEGARGNTADQLNRALRQPENKNAVRDSYQRLSRLIQEKANEVEFETSNGIFTREEFPVKQKFVDVAKQYYDTSITPVDFKSNSQTAAEMINKYVARATKNRVPVLVNAADVQNAYLFITSTMYFKGQWQTPFNRSATKREVFVDDKKNKLGEVNMMYQVNPYPYARIDKIRADALEIPYGFDEKYSMLVLVPRGTQTVTDMLTALTGESVIQILATIKQNHQIFSDEDIHVYLPKFKITSDFNLDRVFERMGVKDIFDPQRADLLGIFPHYLFLSRILQKAEIEVDEEGTVAAAAGGSIFINRAPPPVVRANRPFLYFIVHKETGSIIFAGKVSNPNTLQS